MVDSVHFSFVGNMWHFGLWCASPIYYNWRTEIKSKGKGHNKFRYLRQPKRLNGYWQNCPYKATTYSYVLLRNNRWTTGYNVNKGSIKKKWTDSVFCIYSYIVVLLYNFRQVGLNAQRNGWVKKRALFFFTPGNGQRRIFFGSTLMSFYIVLQITQVLAI